MASYELALLTRALSKPELAVILKRTADSIFKTGGIIRRIDNLGRRKTPYKISNHDAVHKEANYFIIEFTAPPSKLEDIHGAYNRDIDIIRNKIYKIRPEEYKECTLGDEMKPAPYRPAVIKLIEHVKKKEQQRKKFQYNTGLDYYPFQK